jgi:hypothetical protein
MDFKFDKPSDAKTIKILNIIDEYRKRMPARLAQRLH